MSEARVLRYLDTQYGSMLSPQKRFIPSLDYLFIRIDALYPSDWPASTLCTHTCT